MLPASGLWGGRISQVGQTDWFNFPVRANRVFTVVTIAVDEQGQPSNAKAMPAIGIWDAFDPVGAASLGTVPGLNGTAAGETWAQVATQADDIVRMGIADMRGDGRPDYAYNGWVLYADTVTPSNLPLAGGPIVIHGMGFHPADTVLVNGQPAQVTSISPNEITAIAPAAGIGVSGSVDVEIDDLPIYYAGTILLGGISYDSGTGDSLTLVSAPANTVPAGVPIPFTVAALNAALQPAGGVTVTFTVSSGTATLGCGSSSCSVTATGDGLATMNVTAANGSAAVVTASLMNGASLQAHFSGGTPPEISALTPSLSLAAGAAVNWTAEAIVLMNGAPASGQTVSWQAGAGIAMSSTPATLSSLSGIDSETLSVGPLAKGQQATAKACLNGTTQCATFTVLGARPEYATLETLSGTGQSVSISGTPAADGAARARHGRQPHGRRDGDALSGSLCMGAALPAPRPLRPAGTARLPDRHRHLRPGRHGELYAGVNPRRGYQYRRHGLHRKHQYADGGHGAAPVEGHRCAPQSEFPETLCSSACISLK